MDILSSFFTTLLTITLSFFGISENPGAYVPTTKVKHMTVTSNRVGTSTLGTEILPSATTTTNTATTSLVTITPPIIPKGYEVINGITVPPEPDPKVNNATLAGVDVNGNGVRDDVERKIVTLWPTNAVEIFQITSLTQKVLLNKMQDIKDSDAQEVFCLLASPDKLPGVNKKLIDPLTLNTKQRQLAYSENVRAQKYTTVSS